RYRRPRKSNSPLPLRAKGARERPSSLRTLHAVSMQSEGRTASMRRTMPDTSASGRAARSRTRKRAQPLATAGASSRSKIGLALAGGGPLGGIYEVGALLALADSLDGIDFTKLDAYVGVSSGGFVAAALANGISPTQMYRLFIDDGADAALTPEGLLRPAFFEFARRAALVPWLTVRAAVQAFSNPFRAGMMESLATLSHAVPTGMF